MCFSEFSRETNQVDAYTPGFQDSTFLVVLWRPQSPWLALLLSLWPFDIDLPQNSVLGPYLFSPTLIPLVITSNSVAFHAIYTFKGIAQNRKLLFILDPNMSVVISCIFCLSYSLSLSLWLSLSLPSFLFFSLHILHTDTHTYNFFFPKYLRASCRYALLPPNTLEYLHGNKNILLHKHTTIIRCLSGSVG